MSKRSLGQLVVGRWDSRLEDETVLDKALSKFSLLFKIVNGQHTENFAGQSSF